MKGKLEHAAGSLSGIAYTAGTLFCCLQIPQLHVGRHDWQCIKGEAGKQIACSSFIVDLQKETSRYRMGAFSHARQDL